MAAFAKLVGNLGVFLAKEKTEGPNQRMTFLRVELDAISQTSPLPEPKLYDLRNKLKKF